MSKLKILFPFVEAGFGHIMTEKSIADAFEKKYGDYFEIIRCDYYKDYGEPLARFEKRLCDEVKKYNVCHFYGYLNIAAMNLCGRGGLKFVMEDLVKDSYRDGLKRMEEIAPDVVISTHWATNYYAERCGKDIYTVMYVPDAHANKFFRDKCDFTCISTEEGYERALKFKGRYNVENLALTPMAIRKEAFEVDTDKARLKAKLGIADKFTIYVTEGGYGIGMLEKLCKMLIEEDLPISVIAVCGKNPELKARLDKLKPGKNLSFYPYGFCQNPLELIAVSDLYLGKSGNGLMEAAFFDVPIVVTHSANTIERLIAEHYVTYVKDAVRIFNAKKCVKFIKSVLEGDEKYESLKNCNRPNFGGEGIADVIFKKLDEKFKLTQE